MGQTFTFDFGEITLYPSCMLTILKEGVVVVDELTDELITIAQGFYNQKPFVYISQRNHAYTIDPKVYLKVSKMENLMGFAAVMSNPTVIDNTDVEKLFLNSIPFEVFDKLEDAMHWADHVIKHQSKF
ncbi:MAG: hypothetical protein GYB39_08975 [Algicola sp.]|nr:hypothetical protein [Algicola sp.]